MLSPLLPSLQKQIIPLLGAEVPSNSQHTHTQSAYAIVLSVTSFHYPNTILQCSPQSMGERFFYWAALALYTIILLQQPQLRGTSWKVTITAHRN